MEKSFEECKKIFKYYKELDSKKRIGYELAKEKLNKKIDFLWKIVKKSLNSCSRSHTAWGGESTRDRLMDYDMYRIAEYLDCSKDKSIEKLTRSLLDTNIKEIEVYRDLVAKYDTICNLVNSNSFSSFIKAIRIKDAMENIRYTSNLSSKVYESSDAAIAAWKSENPIKEGSFVTWSSKGGTKDATVLSIDRENNKVKIKTEAGAIRNVPISSINLVFLGKLYD